MPDTKWDANYWSLEEADVLNKLAVLRGSADESARHVRGLYVTFLLFAFYVAVIVFSTTDQQLLKETGARLPLLNVELPLIGFYIFIPWLVIIFHVHLMTHFFLLSRKLHNLNQAIASLPEDIQRTHRELPFPLVFSYMIVGRHHPFLLRWAFSTTVVVTVVIVPIVLLLAIQWKFLPYHNSWITLNHQIVFILDLLLLWALWPRMKQQRRQILRVFAASVSTMVMLLVSTLLLVPPGDGIERLLGEQVWLNILHRNLDLREKTLMKAEPLPELIAAYETKGYPPEKVWLDHGKPLDLQGRDLRNANFYRVTLWSVDLRGAQLQGADLDRAQLQGASLQKAQLQGADLQGAELQSASLWKAELQGADLQGAELQGADLWKAQLQSANLQGAKLQGANLWKAELQGAKLGGARLQGVGLQGAQLQSADLRWARLQGADLRGAQLQGANLRQAQLQGAVLRWARIYATDFAKADLSMADIRGLMSIPISWDSDSFKAMEHLESMLTTTTENWRGNARSRVQKALSRFWNIAFNPPLDRTLPTPSQATGALYNHCGLFTNWPPPPDVDTFETKHAALLLDLSCDDRYVTKSVVARALSERSHTLAQAFLDKAASKTCLELTKVVEENRKELEQITQQTKQPPPPS